MTSDFRSLLSTFKTATSDESTQDRKSKKNYDSNVPLKDSIEELWRVTQIKNATSRKRTLESRDNDTKVHLAVCLCIVDSLTHEDIWKQWMSDPQSSTTAELYLHAKHPERISSHWARSKLLKITHQPNWNDVRIVKAMLSLIEKALEDSTTTHVLFGTESCIPIVPLQQIKLKPGFSYVKYFGQNQSTRFDEMHCWNPLQPYIPLNSIHKALPGWCVLSRQHADSILHLPQRLGGKELWTAFQHCWAPEEVYFPTALALLGQLENSTVIQQTVVHAEWNEHARKQEDRAHPKEWDDEFGPELVQRLLRENPKCFVLRKVKRSVPMWRWENAIYFDREPQGRKHESRREHNIGYHDHRKRQKRDDLRQYR